jgi:hypothetical protein
VVADDVRTCAADILDQVRSGSMPCDRARSSDKVEAFKRWTDGAVLYGITVQTPDFT